MSSAAVGTHHSGAGPLSLMSCVRESSPLQDYELDHEKNVASKKKFWNPKKWFKRKNKVAEDVVLPVEISDRDALRSRSTSELSITEEPHTKRRSGSSMHPGLSVSHDSVFHSPNSGSDIELDAAQSSSSLSISQPQIDLRLQTELSERLRLRRGRGDTTSEDDEGLPHSPCNSPTTADVLDCKTVIRDLPTKSHSTCSDGSLLSMGSSEMDEESFGQHSRHSSKLSLHEKRSSDQDSDLDLKPSSAAAVPLNHSGAHHKASIRPKRRAPHRKKTPQLSTALPTTPEVNEDSSVRSMTPDNASREAVTELYSMTSTTTSSSCSSHSLSNARTTLTPTETQLKCSSLPPGLVPPADDDPANHLNRSRSSAGHKSQEHFTTLEEDVEKEEHKDKSFFDRIFPRRSAKKRKSKEDKPPIVGAVNTTTVTSYSRQSESYSRRVESKPMAAPRSGAASRQRIQPIDLPASPEAPKREFGTSPLQAELENRFKARLSTSPEAGPKSPPSSPGKSVIISSSSEFVRKELFCEQQQQRRLKLPGLSSLQQRVLTMDDESDGFKSLTELSPAEEKPKVTKSHSFKAPVSLDQPAVTAVAPKDGERIAKASSLDSIKHLDEPRKFETTRTVESSRDRKVETSRSSKVETSRDSRVEASRDRRTSRDVKVETSRDVKVESSNITISGPSHTAVVNVSEALMGEFREATSEFKEVKESVSVTKIQLKQVSQSSGVPSPKSSVPEFFNRQLNKVEARPASNVVFSTSSSSAPRIIDEQSRPKTLMASPFGSPVGISPEAKAIVPPRKFSQENLEIVEKVVEESPVVAVTPMAQSPPIRFVKKSESKTSVAQRKPSVTSVTPESPKREKPFLRSRSISLDSLKGENNCASDRSSQDSLDRLDEEDRGDKTPVSKSSSSSSAVETVVLRKKSMVKQKNDDEPELMKVFARRSLKLKDGDGEAISQQVAAMVEDSRAKDSDKENQDDSPREERAKKPKLMVRADIPPTEPLKKKSEESQVDNVVVEEPPQQQQQPKIKEALVESKFTESTEVTLRKPNNFHPYQRTISMQPPPTKTEIVDISIKKQSSFSERRKTENWMQQSNLKNGNDLIDRKMAQDEIITGISPKSEYISEEFITETKNFNQRKAEWEKRAQEAQKKTVP